MKINKIEYDENGNTFTLFKKPDEITGKIFYKSNEIAISIPLTFCNNRFFKFSDIENDDDSGETYILESFDNCIDFGIMNRRMWVYYKTGNKYKLISFVIRQEEYSKPEFDQSTLKSYTVTNLNDFVRCQCEF